MRIWLEEKKHKWTVKRIIETISWTFLFVVLTIGSFLNYVFSIFLITLFIMMMLETYVVVIKK